MELHRMHWPGFGATSLGLSRFDSERVVSGFTDATQGS